ncbi:MAG: HepT-like ribonuclease domain-containing protein [Nitrososphaerales archaeon]
MPFLLDEFEGLSTHTYLKIGVFTAYYLILEGKRYPQIPWKDMAGMRDKLIHGYFGVDLRRVWKTVKEDALT